MNSAHFRCFSGCPAAFSVDRAISQCPTCGGLLEVVHDTAALKKRSADEWTRLFDERLGSPTADCRSGVWSAREWVMPHVRDEMIVSTDEGRSSLYRARRLGREVGIDDLRIKQCGTSHTGSFKDLGMTVLVSVVRQAMSDGAISPRPLACASTGDTSAALAAYGAAAGLPVVVLLPRGLISTAQLVQPLANGATVFALDADFDGCMKVIQELADREAIYLANSKNPLRIEGQKTVAIEMTQQLGWEPPDWVIIPSGNLGNAAAIYAGFKMMLDLGVILKMPRLCIAQAANANPMYRAFVAGDAEVAPIAAIKSLASAIQIGRPVSATRAMVALREMNGVVEEATEQELADACARADRTGLYTCPHTGVALACAFKLRARGVIHESDRVVVVSTAHGLKFTEFKLGYHESNLGKVESPLANRPIAVAANADAIAEKIARIGA